MTVIDTETKRKLREMGATPLLEALESQDEDLTMGMSFDERLGVNPRKWTRQCVLSGSNIHHRCIIDLEVNRCSIPQSRVPTPRVITN